MKRLFFTLFSMLLLVGASLNAQQRCSDCDIVLGYSETFALKLGVAGDTIGTGDSTWSVVVLKESQHPLKQNVYFDIDSIGGTAGDVYFIHQGKNFDNDTYDVIDTITTWTGASDTIIKYSITTANQYSINKYLIKGVSDGFKAEVQEYNFKFWED